MRAWISGEIEGRPQRRRLDFQVQKRRNPCRRQRTKVSAPYFALQDEHVIEALLKVATAEALPLERQSYAAGLAAELSTKLGLDPQPVRTVLWKLEHLGRSPDTQLLVAQSLRFLDEGRNPERTPVPIWSAFQLSNLLPEHRPRTVVGRSYTARRPVTKLGHKDPCHCGSGKTYK